MRRKSIVLLSVFVLLVTLPASAQFPSKSVAEIYEVKPKAGADYEAAHKRHIEWHRQQHDTWSYAVWEIISGERSGTYIGGTFGHDWKDFDQRAKMEEADLANFRQTMGPAVQSIAASYWLHRADLSLPVEGQTGPDPYAEVITFFLKPDAWEPDVEESIKRINDALRKGNPAIHGVWYQLLNGGPDALVLAIDHKSWGDFQPSGKEFFTVLTEAYGTQLTRSLFRMFGENISATRSEIFHYRPDLSYTPEASK
jgi:hypothetical protein